MCLCCKILSKVLCCLLRMQNQISNGPYLPWDSGWSGGGEVEKWMSRMQRGRTARGQQLAGWEGCPWLSVAQRALWLLWLLALPQCCSFVVNSCCFTLLLFPHLLSDPNYALACFPVYFQGKSSFRYKLISTVISKSLTSLILFNSNHIGMNKS